MIVVQVDYDNHQYGEDVTQELAMEGIPRHKLIPWNLATLKEYIVLQIAMSVAMTDDSTPDMEMWYLDLFGLKLT